MKLKTLEINGPSQYDSWLGLKGSIEVGDADGTQKITLSAGAIVRIIKVISAEVSQKAVANANRTAQGLQEACDEALLEASAGQLQLD